MKNIALTSNDYVNVLPGFAYLFNKFYPNQEVTVVRYDVRPPKLPENFKQFAIGQQDNYSWSGGLKHYLEQIDDEFVLLMLEDYYLDKHVESNRLQALHTLMDVNKNICKIDLTNDRLKVDYVESEYTQDLVNSDGSITHYPLVESSLNSSFLASVQAAIWRKNFLEAILNTKDNAWQFEKNKRTKEYLKKNKGVILGCVNPPMSYVNVVGGEGNKPGEYDIKKMPEWMIEELKANKAWIPNNV